MTGGRAALRAGVGDPRYIINFPTKRHWRARSRIEDIDAGLRDLVEVIRTRKIQSIAMPALGSGLGGLDWNQVRPRIKAALGGIEALDVVVFEPWVTSEPSRVTVGSKP